METTAIRVKGLRKSYGEVDAVRGIDLSVATGECFALLGPNGAGKTTTVEILEGHRRKSSGDVDVLGHDPGRNERAFKARIGIVLQEPGVERYLTVAEVIEQFRGYYGHPRPLGEILELVGLTDKRDSLVRKLSGGQKRRLDVAIGLAGDPELLFLDEPTTGFDPSARRAAWKMIADLKELGKTVFLTTHYMDEAQTLADRVAIISAGNIVAEGTPASLQAGDVRTRISFFVEDPDAIPATLRARAEIAGTQVHIATEDAVGDLFDLTWWAKGAGVALDNLQVARPSLEDVYLELTRSAEDEGTTKS